MYALFLVCLVGGLVATALLAMLGGLAGHLHAGPTHAHLPAAGHAHTGTLPAQAHAGSPQLSAHGQPVATGHPASAHAGHAQQPVAQAQAAPGWTAMALGWTLSWLSPLLLAAAALGFGGAGLIVQPFLPALALPIAIVGAILGATAVRALIAAFVRAETPALQAVPEGAIGLINAPIREDRTGEVVYTLEGLQRSAPARTVDGTPLPRGARVVIVRRERGIAWVALLDPLPPIQEDMLLPGATPEQPHASSSSTANLEQASRSE